MEFKKLKTILSLLISIALSFAMVNAAADFTLTTSDAVSDSIELDNSLTKTFTIENTGDEVLNLTISKTDLQSNSGSIGIVLGKTAVTDLGVGNTTTFTATYNAALGKELGDYSGLVSVSNDNDTTQVKNQSLNLTVNMVSGAELELLDYDGDLIIITGDLDEKKTKTFKLKNIGTVDLTNVRIKFTDLNGVSSSDDIADNDLDVDDSSVDIDEGDYNRFTMDVDIPDDIDIDTYEGEIRITTDQGFSMDITLHVEVEGGNMELEIDQSGLDVYAGVLKMDGEPGDLIDEFEFLVENKGNLDAQNLEFEIQYDLEELYSSETLSKDLVSFSPSSLDLNSDDEEAIEVSIDIPEDTKSGTYVGKIRLLSSTGKIYDYIRLELKVTGDVYIVDVDMDDEADQDSYFDIDVEIKNQGSSIERGVKVTGTIENIDYGNSDLIETSSSFVLNAGDTRTQSLRFFIPEEASDGSHTVEIKVEYDDGNIVELHEVEVKRPEHNLELVSAGVGQNSITCDDSLFVFSKVKNLGKFDEKADFTVEIKGTSIKKEYDSVTVEVDDTIQKNFELNLNDLESGTYEVINKVIYSGFFLKETNLVTVKDCSSVSTDIDVKPIIDLGQGNQTESDDEKTTIFGQEVGKTTVYLMSGIGSVIILIAISLFFI